MYIYTRNTQKFNKVRKARTICPFLGVEIYLPPLHANKNPQRPLVALVAANEIRSSNYNGSTRWWKIFDRAI